MVPISPSEALPVDPVNPPTPPYTSLSRLGSLDSIEPGEVFVSSSGPVHSGTIYLGHIEPGSVVTLGIDGAILNVSSTNTQTVLLSLMRYMASITPVEGIEYKAYDVYSNTTEVTGILSIIHRPWNPETITSYYLSPGGWNMLPIIDTSTYRSIIDVTRAMGSGVPVILVGSPYTPVVGGKALVAPVVWDYDVYLLAGLAMLITLLYKRYMT